MNELLENYLEKIDRYLKPMTVSERTDIVKEIKSEMQELELQNVPPEKILERLGDPKELAAAYLGDSIAQNKTLSWKKIGLILAFYSMAGFGGMFLFPFAGILSAGLMFGGIIAPVAGLIKFAGYLLGFEVPWVMFQFGSYEAPPLLMLPLSILMGALFILAGRGVWKITMRYVRMVGQKKEKWHVVE